MTLERIYALRPRGPCVCLFSPHPTWGAACTLCVTCVQVEESCESRGIRVAVPIPVPALTRVSRIGALVYIDPLIYVRRFFYGAHVWALYQHTSRASRPPAGARARACAWARASRPRVLCVAHV